MSRRGISLADLGPAARAQAVSKIAADVARHPPGIILKSGHRNKYGAERTPYRSRQGFERVYDSKKEANQAMYLDGLIRSGSLKWWLPQVPIPLPGGVKYIADFLIGWSDGTVTFRDTKGKMTQASKNKIKQVKAMFGIDVEIV